MNSITKLTIISFPTLIGISATLLGLKLIHNEKKIQNRKLELEEQLKSS